MAEKTEVTLVQRTEKAIDDLLASAFRPGTPPRGQEAAQLSQSVLNLVHARNMLISVKN